MSALAGRRIAITGAGRGIGLAIARAATRDGARVAIGDIDAQAAEAAARSLPEAHAFAVDVRDRDSFAEFLDGASEALGGLDVLVNNAGIMLIGPFAAQRSEDIERMIEVNLLGVVHGMQLAIARLEAEGGQIVNIASTAGRVAVRAGGSYSATKFAVRGLSAAVREELRGSGIEVSTVLPGIVSTELADGIKQVRGAKNATPEQVAEAVVRVIARPRAEVVVPRELAALMWVLDLLPARARARMLRAMGAHDTFWESDAQARAAYEDRARGAAASRQA
jgi:NADP-dependent 3-hydroxy acid dehydrogenase YdfG